MSDMKQDAINLAKTIEHYKRKKSFNLWDHSKNLIAENDWAASFFYASVLTHTDFQQYHSLTKEKVYNIYESFRQATGLSVDVEGLFNRSWLRIVNQKVEISGVIRYATFDIDKVANLVNEFKFLCSLVSAHPDRKVSVAEFEKAVGTYSENQVVRLDKKAMETVHWIVNENDTITIQSLDYSRPLIDHVSEFRFIKKIYDCIGDQIQNNLVISKQQFTSIHSKHSALFPLTPSLVELKEKNMLVESGNVYILSFRNSDAPFKGMVRRKAGAILWNSLLNEEEFFNDVDRLRHWFDKMIQNNSWCEIDEYFSIEGKKRFLDAALQIVLEEADLVTGQDEYMKIKLDQGHRAATLAYVFSTEKNELEFPNYTDLFSLYEGIEAIDGRWQHQLMFDQDARTAIAYFIQQIVANDEENSCDRIIQLLEAGSLKPYALWKTCWNLHHLQPHLITQLLTRINTAALGFSLVWKLKQSENIFASQQIVFEQVLTEAFGLICRFLASDRGITNKEKAKVIFQCLQICYHHKMKVIGPDLDKNIQHKLEGSRVVESLCTIFERTTLPGTVFTSDGPGVDLLYPVILKDILNVFRDDEPTDYLRNNALALPFVELDFLLWILKLARSIKDLQASGELRSAIIQEFVALYLDSINTGRKLTWDHSKGEMTEQVPSWHHQQSNIELLSWKNAIIEMDHVNILEDFIHPSNLKLEISENIYEKYNRFTGNKVRTHLSILLAGYHEIYNSQNVLLALGHPVHSILAKIEGKITSLVIKYCINSPQDRRIDIFDALFERTFWSHDKEELLPQIGNVLNRFSSENKNRMLNELVSADQIVRCFKLLEYVVSEKDKAQLLEVLNGQNIQKWFSENYVRTDAEYVLQQLAQYEHFAEKAQEVLTIWEKAKIRGSDALNDQHEINCFRIKLLLAYNEHNEKKIDQIEEPKVKSDPRVHGFSAPRSRNFYKALIYLKKDRAPEAYAIFDSQLRAGGSDSISLGLNRFAAKIKWADDTTDLNKKRRLYQEAIDEWVSYETTLPQQSELETVKEKVWVNKLHVYLALKDYSLFDEQFNRLEKPVQLNADILELHVNSLIHRKMQRQAETILAEAEEYHKLADGSSPEFILRLKTLLENDDLIKILKDQYFSIFSRSPESLIKILPHKFTRDLSLPEFILNELTNVAADVLIYVNSVSSIRGEDKYSDLMVLSLCNRFRNYGWHVGNARGGFPESGKLNPGEIDFAIFGAGQRITICEALILHGKNISNVSKHNFKVFNYDPSRKFFYIIVYYLGDKFQAHWDGYKTDLTSFIEFPQGFELDGQVKDVTGVFGDNSVQVGQSKHGTTTELFHIFININYHKKRVKKKK